MCSIKPVYGILESCTNKDGEPYEPGNWRNKYGGRAGLLIILMRQERWKLLFYPCDPDLFPSYANAYIHQIECEDGRFIMETSNSIYIFQEDETAVPEEVRPLLEFSASVSSELYCD